MSQTIAHMVRDNKNDMGILDVANNIAIYEDQDWDHEETTFTFKDGSKLLVSYDCVEVLIS